MTRRDKDMETNKTKIVIEALDNGKVRIAVDGRPYLVQNGDGQENLSVVEISEIWLTEFNPGANDDRGAYSSQQCTEANFWHPNACCDATCHDFNCAEPAAFFHHWRTPDTAEHCMPVCKYHGREMAFYVGRTVLLALDYGIPQDLRFWTDEDPLPDGRPRCDRRYRAADDYGLTRARCTAVATQVVRLIDGGRDGETYQAKLCDRCFQHAIEDAGVGREIEIVGPVSLSVLPSTDSEEPSRGK
jgi:hypothetical protein